MNITSIKVSRGKLIGSCKVHIFWEGHKIFCKISTLLLSYVVPVKSKVEISQNFVAFSEYINFTWQYSDLGLNEWTKWLLTFLDGTIFLNSANVNSSLSLARFSLKTFSKCLRFSGVSSVRFLQVQIDKYFMINTTNYGYTIPNSLRPKFKSQSQINIWVVNTKA